MLSSAAAGLKPFSASGAPCEVNGRDEASMKSSLQYDELMAEHAAVSTALVHDVGAALQVFDQNTHRSSADGFYASAAVSLPSSLRAQECHSLSILARRVEVATGVARDLAVDVTTLESSIANNKAETSTASRSRLVSTWGRPKSASNLPQNGRATRHATVKSNTMTSGRSPPSHAAGTAAHRCRTALTRHKKVADAQSNPFKGRCVHRMIDKVMMRQIH